MTRQEEIVKGFNESWSQFGINVSSNVSNPINGITVNNPNGGRAVALNFIDGVNATKLTAAQIAALPNPQAGQIVYQTDGVTGVYVYDGASWTKVGGLSSVNGTTNRITVTGGDTIDIASTYVGQTSITTLGTITTGTWTGIIGQATMTLGSDATGDIYYRNSGGNLTRLGIGSAGQVLGVSAGIPAWQAAGSGITVGTTTITSGTSGRIAFNNSGVYGESSNLQFDNSNIRIGLGLTPQVGIDVLGGGVTPYMRLGNTGGNSTHLFNNNTTSYLRHVVGASVGSEVALNNNNVNIMNAFQIFATGNIISYPTSIKTSAAPTAHLHIGAGTAAASTAPLKLTAGTNLTTPENGAFEFDGTNLYFTVGGVRKTVTLV
jgi:hypothetical protein